MIEAAVLTGVDGSPASLAAVDVARCEASLRHRALRLVFVDPWAAHPAMVADGHLAEDLLSDPKAALHAALDRASASRKQGIAVTGEVLAGDPASVLIRESATAEMVVLGHRGRGGFPELLLGSVAAKVAAHAACPVLVTRNGAPQTGDVVVGVDDAHGGDGGNDPAHAHPELAFAFEEAAMRGTGVHAVRVWTGTRLAGRVALYDPEADQRDQERTLEEAVATWRRRYPKVPVRTELMPGPVTRAVLGAGAGAVMIVLGARGARGAPGRRLGSVVHAALHHATCPVAVVTPRRGSF
jgi:nucleotide-binding universal stress UspA family protein